jgi:hypothetical protein
MNLKIEIKILKSLVEGYAKSIGPMTVEYVKSVGKDTFSIDYDWYIFAKIFHYYGDTALLEKACQRALELNILDVLKFEIMLSMMDSSVNEYF